MYEYYPYSHYTPYTHFQRLRQHLELVTAPPTEAIDVQDVLDHLRLNDDERLVHNLIQAAQAQLDGRDGWLGRALLTQTWKLKLDRFRHEITLPLPPLQSVASITYVDATGATQTIDPADYQVQTSNPAHIVPAYGKCWPSARWQPDAVTVQFTCGYGDTPDAIPMPIRQALLLLVAHFYENRQAVQVFTSRAGAEPLPMGIDYLLAPYRVWPL